MAVNNWIEANLIWITLAITILVLMYFVYAIIQTIRRKRSFVSQLNIILLILGLMFLIFLTYHANEIEGKDWGQIILMLGLVIVTALYASSTEKQATASVKMAEGMRQQRYTQCLPLLVPDITRRSIVSKKLESNEVDYGTLRTGVGLEVTWHNLGKGVAINTRLSFRSSLPLDSHPGEALFFPPRESQALGVGGQKEIAFRDTWELYDIQEGHHTKLKAEYQDIYERNITTIQEFRIDEENKRAFVGELYFTINGRRLGEESEND